MKGCPASSLQHVLSGRKVVERIGVLAGCGAILRSNSCNDLNDGPCDSVSKDCRAVACPVSRHWDPTAFGPPVQLPSPALTSSLQLTQSCQELSQPAINIAVSSLGLSILREIRIHILGQVLTIMSSLCAAAGRYPNVYMPDCKRWKRTPARQDTTPMQTPARQDATPRRTPARQDATPRRTPARQDAPLGGLASEVPSRSV